MSSKQLLLYSPLLLLPLQCNCSCNKLLTIFIYIASLQFPQRINRHRFNSSSNSCSCCCSKATAFASTSASASASASASVPTLALPSSASELIQQPQQEEIPSRNLKNQSQTYQHQQGYYPELLFNKHQRCKATTTASFLSSSITPSLSSSSSSSRSSLPSPLSFLACYVPAKEHKTFHNLRTLNNQYLVHKRYSIRNPAKRSGIPSLEIKYLLEQKQHLQLHQQQEQKQNQNQNQLYHQLDRIRKELISSILDYKFIIQNYIKLSLRLNHLRDCLLVVWPFPITAFFSTKIGSSLSSLS